MWHTPQKRKSPENDRTPGFFISTATVRTILLAGGAVLAKPNVTLRMLNQQSPSLTPAIQKIAAPHSWKAAI
jgi:hypothetical protein